MSKNRIVNLNFAKRALISGNYVNITIEINLLCRINLNQDIVILKVYEIFLNKNGNIKSQYIPYYFKWVSDCYQFLNQPLSTRSKSGQKRKFPLDMGKKYEDWQVNQANAALRLYDYFLSKNISPMIGDISSSKETLQLFEEKMRDALSLRHRSFSTEKTYLLWLKSFKDSVNYKSPDQLEGRDLQDFLSHLAVDKKVSPSAQNQAHNAIVFFYRHVLDRNIDVIFLSIRQNPEFL